MAITAPAIDGCAEAELGALLLRFRLIGQDLAISLNQLALVLGTSEERLRRLSLREPPAVALETAIRLFVDLIDHASLLFGGRSETSAWLQMPHPLLRDGGTLLDVLMSQPWLLRQMSRELRRQCAEEGRLPEPVL